MRSHPPQALVLCIIRKSHQNYNSLKDQEPSSTFTGLPTGAGTPGTKKIFCVVVVNGNITYPGRLYLSTYSHSDRELFTIGPKEMGVASNFYLLA